ncbi:MAG TPA: hypothetical protein VIO11_01555 [Candidatus Methanoperedens sp.]
MLVINGCIGNFENNTSNKLNSGTMYFKTYTDANFNYSIQYPGDWEIIRNKSKISFIYPKNSMDGYTTLNLQILLSPDNGGKYKSIEDVILDLEQQLQKITKNLKIIYERENMLGVSKGEELSVSYTLNDLNYTQTMIIAKAGSNFYVLTYFSPSARYEQYIYAYEQARKSFKYTR